VTDLKPLQRDAPDGTVEVGRSRELPCHGWLRSVPVAEVTWLRIVNESTSQHQKLEINERMAIVEGFNKSSFSRSGISLCKTCMYNV
jgi:hypothetical protein